MSIDDYLLSYIVMCSSRIIASDNTTKYKNIQLKDVWSIRILGSRRTNFVISFEPDKLGGVDKVKSYSRKLCFTFPTSTSMDVVLHTLTEALLKL